MSSNGRDGRMQLHVTEEKCQIIAKQAHIDQTLSGTVGSRVRWTEISKIIDVGVDLADSR